ncbi:hypothetical protein NSP53_23655, partial [Salmonella enterica]|nr:hypothetical protein [Salmonella enterica]
EFLEKTVQIIAGKAVGNALFGKALAFHRIKIIECSAVFRITFCSINPPCTCFIITAGMLAVLFAFA